MPEVAIMDGCTEQFVQQPEEHTSEQIALPPNNIVDEVSNFIQGVRLQSSISKSVPANGGDAVQQPSTSGSGLNAVEQQSKDRANQLILEAERYKASVNNPSGMFATAASNNELNANVTALDDDEFFHVTCHIEESLRNKIERGQFVELEKLLPKNRTSEDTEMKLVFREGKSYFVPVQGPTRINSVRKWEQSFRIYAAIYSQANPSRAAEIWQYVHVINMAASTYIWENVSSYDITFRRLMAQNPGRSWSKIYNQMWNLSMRQVIPRNQQNSFGQQDNRRSSYGGGGSGPSNANNNANQGVRKPKYCWGFNRVGGCKDGNKCKYVDRCSYCDAADPGKQSCPKK